MPILLTTFTAAPAVGGLSSGSLALLADAGHMLTDATGVGVAPIASTRAPRPATDSRSYGWQRAERRWAPGSCWAQPWVDQYRRVRSTPHSHSMVAPRAADEAEGR